MVLKESELRIRSSKDIMLGVSTALLSKALPTELKMLICDMATGFKLYCKGALEAKFNKKATLNRRDINCLGIKFLWEPPQKNGWIC